MGVSGLVKASSVNSMWTYMGYPPRSVGFALSTSCWMQFSCHEMNSSTENSSYPKLFGTLDSEVWSLTMPLETDWPAQSGGAEIVRREEPSRNSSSNHLEHASTEKIVESREHHDRAVQARIDDKKNELLLQVSDKKSELANKTSKNKHLTPRL